MSSRGKKSNRVHPAVQGSRDYRLVAIHAHRAGFGMVWEYALIESQAPRILVLSVSRIIGKGITSNSN
jgi:hypothetical protein